jgi:hypothetical protein
MLGIKPRNLGTISTILVGKMEGRKEGRKERKGKGVHIYID